MIKKIVILCLSMFLCGGCGLKKQALIKRQLNNPIPSLVKDQADPIVTLKNLNNKWATSLKTIEHRTTGFVNAPNIPQLSNTKLTAHIRLYPDSLIWISFKSAFMNLEVLRTKLTLERVSLFFPFNKGEKIQELSYQELANYYEIPMTYHDVQDILLFNFPKKEPPKIHIIQETLQINQQDTIGNLVRKIKAKINKGSTTCFPQHITREYTIKEGKKKGTKMRVTQHITSDTTNIISWSSQFTLDVIGKETIELTLNSKRILKNILIQTPFPVQSNKPL